jgi:hypothetical protein
MVNEWLRKIYIVVKSVDGKQTLDSTVYEQA